MGRSQWQRALQQLTSREAFQARLYLHEIGTSKVDAGSLPKFTLIEEHVRFLLARLSDLPSGNVRDQRLARNLSRQVQQTVEVVAPVVAGGLVPAHLDADVAAANEALDAFAPHTAHSLVIPWPDKTLDREKLAQDAAETGYEERRRLLGSALAYWIASVLGAIWLNGALYTLAHFRTRSVTGFITYWQNTSQALTSLRTQLLPLAALAAALLALPMLSTLANLGESSERRGQQLLLQLVARITLGTVAVGSLLATPLRKIPQASGPPAAPTGDWVLAISISGFACLMACVLQVAAEERLRIMADSQARLVLVNAELVRLPKGDTEPKKQGWPGRWLLAWDWWVPVLLIWVAIPGGIVVMQHYHRGLWRALLWVPVSIIVSWFGLEFLTRSLVHDRWEKAIRVKKRLWLDSLSPLGVILALCISSVLAFPVALRPSSTMWIISLAWCFIPFIVYPWVRRTKPTERHRQLHVEYLQREKRLSIETIENQQRYLPPGA